MFLSLDAAGTLRHMTDVTLRRLQKFPLTEWLKLWAAGERDAADKLHAALAPYLERAAKRVLRGHPTCGEMSPKELIHEAWVRMSSQGRHQFKNRRHFFGSAVRAMHFELIDRYRGKQKAEERHSLMEPGDSDPGSGDRLALRTALEQLEAKFPDQAEALLLHKLAGMTHREVATEMEVAVITARRYIDFAEAWVKRLLLDSRGTSGGDEDTRQP